MHIYLVCLCTPALTGCTAASLLTLSTVVLVGIRSQAHQRALCENRLLDSVPGLTPDKYSGGNKERSKPDNQSEVRRLSSTEHIKGAKVSAVVLIFIWFNVLRPRRAQSWRWELEGSARAK